MRDIINSLTETQIVDQKKLTLLKEYISYKFPQANHGKRAAILADAIHRVIESHISEFEASYRASIRLNTLSRALTKSSFSINAGDIFCACIYVYPGSDNFLDALMKWINKQQQQIISKKTLASFIENVRRYNISSPDFVWDLVFNTMDKPYINEQQNPILSAPPPLSEQKPRFFLKLFRRHIYKLAAAGVAVLSLVIAPYLNAAFSIPVAAPTPINSEAIEAGVVTSKTKNSLPSYLQYRQIDTLTVQKYLQAKNSILAEEPYFTEIHNAARDFNINPLLLFAIAGHEQAFVPKSHKQAKKMANNPFNVYQSWEKYNTDIRDSSRIAARTIISSSADRPKDVDAIEWINRRYAEDTNWWVGVNKIFRDLESTIAPDKRK